MTVPHGNLLFHKVILKKERNRMYGWVEKKEGIN